MLNRKLVAVSVSVLLTLGAGNAAFAATPVPTPASGTVDIDRISAKTQRFANTLIGKLPSVAARSTAAHGYYLRIVSVDGVGRPVTMDYWATRINLEFVKGRISKVSVG